MPRHWNYRLLYHEGEDFCALHEVHYNPDGDPIACTASPVAPTGSDPEDLASKLCDALGKPVLRYEYFDDIETLGSRAERGQRKARIEGKTPEEMIQHLLDKATKDHA